jgi:hypothetical protein
VEDHWQHEPRAFTTRNAATLLDMSPDVLRYHIRAKQIQAVRIGRKLFVPAHEIAHLLDTKRGTEDAPWEAGRAR